MDEERPTVWVVDDDEAMRDSLGMLLRSAGIMAEACASAHEFLERWSPDRHGCAVLDIRMPGMDGLELQQELARRGAKVPVIFITGHGDVPLAVQAMQRGAVHFLQKPFADQELLDAIAKALALDAGAHAEEFELRESRERLAALTPREGEVMARVVDGQANKVIAIELGLSQRTVEIHRARVMQKMGCRSLADLVRQVMRLKEAGDG